MSASAKRDGISVKRGGLSRGTNQAGVRVYNERLVLSLIRRHTSLPKAEIARATGLSPQTISIITNQLCDDGLLLKGTPQRGQIGQPSVPYSLNPEGAYSFGLKIGRRSVDLYLIDFVGTVLELLHETYPYPMPERIRSFAREGTQTLLDRLPPERRDRITGLGIAAPYEMWSWPAELGAPQSDIDAWRTVDMRAEIAGQCDWPVYFYNDVTAACAAELMFGRGGDHTDYLYVYIGSFLGGGLVLDGHLFPGRRQNAGALGSIPAPNTSGSDKPLQLMNVASIYVLERKLEALGIDASVLWQAPDDWGDLGTVLDEWIDEVARNLAVAITGAVAVVDVETVILDGAFPQDVRTRVIDRTREAMTRLSTQGLSPFRVVEGTIGNAARAMGGAAIPLLDNFTRDREVLFKDTPEQMR